MDTISAGKQAAEAEADSGEIKDDTSKPTYITYLILFVCFSLLFLFGFVNLYLARKIRKLAKPMVTFYFVSQIVVFFRILLFLDPLVHWGATTYVVILISMPSYLYLMVGLSQVMLTLESIVKYKNFKIREERAVTECQFESRVQRNQRILMFSYYLLYLLSFSIVAFFVSAAIFCRAKQCEFSGSYFGPLYLAIMNVVVWILLSVSTCSFVQMLNKRFGEKEFSGPKCRFIIFLAVFSISFFIRGTWDLVITIKSELQWTQAEMAVVIFIVYFFTECVPVFVIYLAHALAFHEQIKRRQRLQSELKEQDCEEDKSLLFPSEASLSKQDEFMALLAHGTRSPENSAHQKRSYSAALKVNYSNEGPLRKPSDAQRESILNDSPPQQQRPVNKNLAKSELVQESGRTSREQGPNSSAQFYNLAVDKQVTSEQDQITEHGEQKFLTRATDVISGIEEVNFNPGSDGETDSGDGRASGQGRIRLSLFKTENGTSMFPKSSPPRMDYITNTLQPISSEAGGTSNGFGSSVSPGIANLSKRTDTNPSDAQPGGHHLNTGHTDSAFVASYIEDVNREVNPNSLLDSPSEEPPSPVFRKR